MQQDVMYLRKSRADIQAEEQGELETLARHEKTLTELALKRGYNIVKTYREVVSGESIAARPEMQKLLAEVEAGIYDNVLVMEIERLARGDSIDQGVIARAFRYTGTKIVTPVKVYDPSNEFDEEYLEFGLFMSRREYKTINRRLQAGRLASVKEGKWVSNKAPLGYKRVKLDKEKGFTLEIIPEEAAIVKMIFQLYTEGIEENGTKERIGTSLIAQRLNSLGFKTKNGNAWSCPSVRDLLINPVYIGKVKWNWRPAVKQIVDGNVTYSRPRNKDVFLTDGLHQPIISEETFNAAQTIINGNRANPVRRDKVIMNPLSGIVVCGKCKHRMQRRPYQDSRTPTLICQTLNCNNVGSDLDIVELRIIHALEEWLNDYKLKWNNSTLNKNDESEAALALQIKNIEKQKAELQKQLTNACEFLEKGVYTPDLFKTRSDAINAELNSLNIEADKLNKLLKNIDQRKIEAKTIIPKIEKLIDVYFSLPDAATKNKMLKEVIERVEYTREKGGRWVENKDNFDLKIFPKLPKSHY